VKRRPLTLKRLMIAIAVIAVGMAILVKPNHLWAFLLPPVLVAMSLTAILGLLFRRGRKRAYWTGFALFGWVYLILNLFLFWDRDSQAPISFRDIIQEFLIIVIEIFASPGVITSEQASKAMAEWPGFVVEITKVDDDSRFLVACAVAGPVFAWIGGTIARVFASDEAAPARQDSPPNPAIGAEPRGPSKTVEPASPPSERPAGSQD
jgi:hypothetical protein